MTIIRENIYKDDIPVSSAEHKECLKALKERPIDLFDTPEEFD